MYYFVKYIEKVLFLVYPGYIFLIRKKTFTKKKILLSQYGAGLHMGPDVFISRTHSAIRIIDS